MTLAHARPRPWTIEEFERLSRMGVFKPGERVELIEGEIIAMAAHNPPHWQAILRGNDVLVPALRDTHYVGVQVPVDIPELSQPEPDFLVLPRRNFPSRDAGSADLIIEVADTSLDYDRHEKASLYARARVPEYWIVNLVERQLEVHRRPIPMPGRVFGHGYAEIRYHSAAESVSTLCRPDVEIAVAALLDVADR